VGLTQSPICRLIHDNGRVMSAASAATKTSRAAAGTQLSPISMRPFEMH
jgi:hypothetical protein